MPKMHPSYTTNLVRRTYGCHSLQYADELILASIAATAATARALVSGEIDVRQSQRASRGFHDGAFDWLYFKGETIRILNDRLRKDGVNFTDGTLIEGICMLIILEAGIAVVV